MSLEEDRENRKKQIKEDAKLQRRRIYLQRKEFLKNSPEHQRKLQLQKEYLKQMRADQRQKLKDLPKKDQQNLESLNLPLNSTELNSRSLKDDKNPFDLLMSTGSNSTPRPLGEIINVDFSVRKKKSTFNQDL